MLLPRVNWKLASVTKDAASGRYLLAYDTPEGRTTLRARSVVLTAPSYVVADLLKQEVVSVRVCVGGGGAGMAGLGTGGGAGSGRGVAEKGDTEESGGGDGGRRDEAADLLEQEVVSVRVCVCGGGAKAGAPTGVCGTEGFVCCRPGQEGGAQVLRK